MFQNLHLSHTAGGVAILTFDRPNSGANIFDLTTLDELNRALDELHANPPRGLILTGAKPRIFFSGADIETFSRLRARDESIEIARLGQETFNRIADFPFPTVAAIHGQALGGGCEMALASDWRVLSDSPETRIGLPEIRLGILPAWGGSHRLPQLIGLTEALGMILSGQAVSAQKALRLGLTDRLAPRDELLQIAQALLAEKPPSRKKFRWPELAFLKRSVHRNVKARLMAVTRGLQPAPLRALEVVMAGFRRPRAEALALEREALADLLPTAESAHLVQIFLKQEGIKRPRGFSPEPAPLPPSRIAVIGAGAMGAGMAMWHSARGQEVWVCGSSPSDKGAVLERIRARYDKAVRKGKISEGAAREGMTRVHELAKKDSLKGAEVMIESVPEILETKQEIFRDLEGFASPDALLASNTSALSLTAIAAAVRDPSRVLGLHYFHPPERMPLVEVVRAPATSQGAVDRAMAFVRAAGKLPIVVRDSPGFVVNRILAPYLLEACRLFQSGVPHERIENAMLDFGMPAGPLRVLDEIGIETVRRVAETLSVAYPERIRLSTIFEAMMRVGACGRSAGKGFYRYPHKKKPRPNPDAMAWVENKSLACLRPDEVRDRMLVRMIHEAALCREEGIAESASDIDFAMVFGAGFPAFRGGPLRYAEELGNARIASLLQTMAATDAASTPTDIFET